MSVLLEARALVLATLLAVCMGVALPATEASAHGFGYPTTAKKTTANKKTTARAKSHRSSKRKARRVRHAKKSRRSKASYRRHRMSLGATTASHSRKIRRRSRGGGGVSWSASSRCLNGTLRSVIYQVASRYGSLRVNSTCRSRSRNRRVGGARRSHHLTGNAVDFRVFGNVGAVASFLRSHGSIGGYKHYGGGLFHIDTGPRRRW